MLVNQFLLLGAVLFSIGVYGALARKNAVLVLMSIELILNSVNINLLAFSMMNSNIDGQVFSGTAIGTNNTTVQMRNINRAFLQNLYWGRSAFIRVNQYDLVLSLTGSKAIIDAGLRYLRGG